MKREFTLTLEGIEYPVLVEGDTINVTLRDGGGTVCMVKVSDEKKAYQKIDQAITALPQMITKAVAEQPALGMLAAFALRSGDDHHRAMEQQRWSRVRGR